MISACGFGAMAIFAKKAYAAGGDVVSLLTLRFVLAGAAFWLLTRAVRAARPSRRVVRAGLLLGGVGYAAQSGLYFGALERIEASLTALLLYTYPALVVVGALALGRERATPRRVGALLLASGGTGLVLAGGGTGSVDGLGVAMGLGAALAYTAYILVSEGVLEEAEPLVLSALIATGAAVTFTVASLVRGGGPDLGFIADGWVWLLGIVVVSTVLPVLAFFAGVRRVGASTASIVSTAEPVVTVGLAALVFSESLGVVQLAGGALVLVAVVVLQWRAGSVRIDGPPDHAAPGTTARPVARQPA